MILRRFGASYESVEPDFKHQALTEISFRRTGAVSISPADLERDYERADGRELTAQAEGDVKHEIEQQLLDRLRDQLAAVEAEAGADAVVVIENLAGQDYPKTRDRTTNTVVAGVNRLHFTYTVDPPLRVGIYRRRG